MVLTLIVKAILQGGSMPMFCRATRKNILRRTTAIVPLFLIIFSLQGGAQTSERGSNTESDKPSDISNQLGLLIAFEGAGGWQPGFATAPAAYGGVKLGGDGFTLDMGYDRFEGHSGFSAEASAMLPIFRLPGPQKNEKKNYLRVYAEPGVGYHAGGSWDGYASAKVMVVLFSDYRLTTTSTAWSPFVELQRRFPFTSPLRGDNRIGVGIMWAICNHCGLD